MDDARFDALTRRLTAPDSRRRILVAAGGACGLFGLIRPAAAAAKKRKKKPKRAKPNAFGCLDVGQPCAGQDGRCCSGVCQGAKPKKGKRDRSRCVAHHTGGCTADRHICFDPDGSSCSVASTTARCFKTTGNAGFCAEYGGFRHVANCQPCRRDPDCEALGFGPGAACVIVRTEGVCANGCEGFNDSPGTACFPAAAP